MLTFEEKLENEQSYNKLTLLFNDEYLQKQYNLTKKKIYIQKNAQINLLSLFQYIILVTLEFVYDFNNGLPKTHEHDGKSPQAFGLFYEGRLVCLYTYECDLGDGWEDPEVHKDSPEARNNALKMGANIIQYVFTLATK